MPGFRDPAVRPLRGEAEFAALNALFDAVWGTPALTRLPWPTLQALTAAPVTSAIALGAWDGDALVGGLLAFATAEPGTWYMDLLGVAAAARGRGVAPALCAAARADLLARGARRLAWTYDPLSRPAARLYIGKLGAMGTAYLPDFYGDQEDRLWAVWDLSDAPRPAAGGEPLAIPAPGAVGRRASRAAYEAALAAGRMFVGLTPEGDHYLLTPGPAL